MEYLSISLHGIARKEGNGCLRGQPIHTLM